MTTLTEFLSTADADSSVALTQARAFSEQVLKPLEGRMLNERTVLGLIGMASGETFMQSLEAAPDSMIPARVKVWFKPSEAGIDIGSPTAVQLVDSMAKAGAITASNAGLLKGYAYDTVTPFERITLHDVLLARNNCPTIAVTTSGGYAVITVNVDVEAHNPQVYATNPRTNKQERINGFRNVSKAGLYDCVIPSEWRNSALSVDDAYGVIEAV